MKLWSSEYAVARHIYMPIIKRGVVDFAVSADWTPATGDVKVIIDGGTAANITTLPSAITSGNTAVWDFPLTIAEMTGKQIVVMISDSATKAVEDDGFVIETWGDGNGQFDLRKLIDAFFKRDFSAITGEAARSMLNAMRILRNKFSVAGLTLTVKKEDDSTDAWTSTLTKAAGDPITSSDPT